MDCGEVGIVLTGGWVGPLVWGSGGGGSCAPLRGWRRHVGFKLESGKGVVRVSDGGGEVAKGYSQLVLGNGLGKR